MADGIIVVVVGNSCSWSSSCSSSRTIIVYIVLAVTCKFSFCIGRLQWAIIRLFSYS